MLGSCKLLMLSLKYLKACEKSSFIREEMELSATALCSEVVSNFLFGKSVQTSSNNDKADCQVFWHLSLLKP